MSKKKEETATQELDLTSLTPEQKDAKLQELLAHNAKLAEANKSLKEEVKKSASEKPAALPTFEVDETDEDGKETGEVATYRFAMPRFIVDRIEYTAAEAVKNEKICAHLVEIGSGIVEKIEKGGK
jgi:hypothetical protein